MTIYYVNLHHLNLPWLPLTSVDLHWLAFKWPDLYLTSTASYFIFNIEFLNASFMVGAELLQIAFLILWSNWGLKDKLNKHWYVWLNWFHLLQLVPPASAGATCINWFHLRKLLSSAWTGSICLNWFYLLELVLVAWTGSICLTWCYLLNSVHLLKLVPSA